MLKGPLRSLQWIFHTFHVMVIQGKLEKGRSGKGTRKPPRVPRLHHGYNGGTGMDHLLLLGKIQAIINGLTDRELRMLYNRLLAAKNGRIT